VGGGGYRQSIPAARRTNIIKPVYPGLEAVKPVNPGLKNTPRVLHSLLDAEGKILEVGGRIMKFIINLTSGHKQVG